MFKVDVLFSSATYFPMYVLGAGAFVPKVGHLNKILKINI